MVPYEESDDVPVPQPQSLKLPQLFGEAMDSAVGGADGGVEEVGEADRRDTDGSPFHGGARSGVPDDESGLAGILDADCRTVRGQRPASRRELAELILRYRDEQARESARTIWPIAIGYLDTVRLIIAWCETRRDFRHFRTDRVIDAKFLEERYPERPSTLRARWKRQITQRAAKAAP